MSSSGQSDILGLTSREITSLLGNGPAFRGRQVFQWLHLRRAESFDQMTNIPAAIRQTLINQGAVYSSKEDVIETAPDGTRKLRIALSDGNLIEAVLLRDGSDRYTACLSTQVGCAMGCRFCKTATMGFIRNLSAAEIVEEFYLLEKTAGGAGSIDSVVYMGMGEPFRNYSEVSRSITILGAPEGRNMSPRRFTVSTSGVVDGIERMGKDHPQVRLAVSLISAHHETRLSLMPVEQSAPLPRLKKALLSYQKNGGRRITLEYVLLKGINHTEKDLRAVRDFADGLKCNINLIPWNPAEGIPPVVSSDGKKIELAEPDETAVRTFSTGLEKMGLTVVLRYKKGRGVSAACGQLATKPRH